MDTAIGVLFCIIAGLVLVAVCLHLYGKTFKWES